MTALYISNRFATWKRDSRAQNINFIVGQDYPYLYVSKPENAFSENQRIDHKEDLNMHYMNISKPQKTILEYQQIEIFSWRHWPYINDTQPENAISEHQQINFIAGQHCPYFIYSHLETLFLSMRKSTLLQDGTAHIWTFRSLKMPFLSFSK